MGVRVNEGLLSSSVSRFIQPVVWTELLSGVPPAVGLTQPPLKDDAGKTTCDPNKHD